MTLFNRSSGGFSGHVMLQASDEPDLLRRTVKVEENNKVCVWVNRTFLKNYLN